MESTTRLEMNKTDEGTWNLDVFVSYYDLEQPQLVELQTLYFDFFNDVVEMMEPTEEESSE